MLTGFNDEPPLWRRHALRSLSFLTLALALLGLVAWVARRGWHHDVAQLWRQERGAAHAVLALGVGVLLVTFFTYLLEHRINEDFSTPWETLWSITVYLHVIVELVDSANERVVDEIAGDFPGVVERVSGLLVRTCLIAQAALSEGVTELYQDLLRVSGDTNEVYTEPIPKQAEGRTFREYAAAIFSRESDNPVIPLGVQRSVNGAKKMFSNPRPGEEGYVLQSGDSLVLMAYEPPGEAALPTL